MAQPAVGPIVFRMIGYILYKLGGFLAHHLPQRLSECITDVLATTQYHLRRGSRRVVSENLHIIMGETAGEDEIHHAVRQVFANFAKSILCLLRLPYLPPEELTRRCDHRGIEEVTSRLRRKGGFVLVGPHVGPWELGGACLSALGNRIHTVALEHPSAKVTEFFNERRRTMGIQCYPMGNSFVALRQALQNGDCVALLIDRRYRKGGTTHRLFDRDVSLPVGYARLAVQCRAPVLMVICVFAGGRGFKFVYSGPYYPDSTIDVESAVDRLHEHCRKDMERFIRAYPDQWFNFEPLGGEKR